MKTPHSNIFHPNTWLRWLFLAVLSIGILHFQEINDRGLNRIELVGSDRLARSREQTFSIYHQFSPERPATSFSDCKNQQASFLNILNQRLSSLAQRPATFFHPTIVRDILSCQHFASRSLSPEDSSDFHS